MKVLLQRDVPNVGKIGEVKEVKEGFARNYLIPQNFAVCATPVAIRTRERDTAKLEHLHQEQKKAVRDLALRINASKLEFREPCSPEGRLYGGIHKERIVQTLIERDIVIDVSSVVVKQPFKIPGSYMVEIRLKFGIIASLPITIMSI